VIDPSLTATAEAVVALAVAVPVVVLGGGTALLVRANRRRRSADGQAGPTPDAATRGGLTPKPAPTDRPTAKPKPSTTRPSPEVRTPGAPAAASAGETPAAEAVEEAPPEPATYRGRMGKARGLLAGYLGAVRAKGKVDASTWDDLEEALIRADVGVGATDALLDDLRGRVKAGQIVGADALIDALKEDLVASLTASAAPLADPGARSAAEPDGGSADDRPVDVWLFVGVNGVGKTTTVGKVAKRLSAGGTTVLLAAGDTFRAAAAEQLSLWADRADAEIVRGAEGGDPSSVVFDAVQRAASRGHQVVLADTAGRLHNKVNLIEELKKIRRVADRPPGRVAEVLLVLDATTGQNGLAQAKVFLEAVDVSGVVLTKLDGTAKGGIVVAIERELGLPVKLVGLGEGADDLVAFDPAAFVDALF
jgi:fused signal recognition particle receptor